MILMNDFKAESDNLRDSMLKATQRVIESGLYVLGKEVKQFENQWAKSCGVSHGVCKIRRRSLFSSGKASHLLVASLIDDSPFVG